MGTGYRGFVDTSPLIYFLDNDTRYGTKVQRIFENVLSGGGVLVFSAITCMEYLVYPYKLGNQNKIAAFQDFVADCKVEICPIDFETANLAAKLRSQYVAIHAMDALQLASARKNCCDVFLTNDKQLQQCKIINIIFVEQWQ